MSRRFGPRWGTQPPEGPWVFPFFGPHPRFFGPHGPNKFWAGPKDGPPFGLPPGPRWGGPPFGDDPFGPGPGRRRQRRGDIKYALLELLAERPRHGYELIKELEQRYGGFYRPSPGSVYPTLQLLEDEGHLSASEQEGKKVYTVTESGQRLLAERQAAPTDERGGPGGRPWGRGPMHGGAPELPELRTRMQGLMAAVQQVAEHGSPAHLQAAMAQLDTARRELYRILAEDGERAEG